MNINGNGSEPGAGTNHSNQLVFINNSASNGIEIQRCETGVVVRNIRVTAPDNQTCFRFFNCPQGLFSACYALSLGKASGNSVGFLHESSKGSTSRCRVSNNSLGVRGFNFSLSTSDNNDTTGTLPDFGLNTDRATMCKRQTQPSGAIANEAVAHGGIIRT